MPRAGHMLIVLCGCLGLQTPSHAAAERVRWQCDVAYLPQRSTWVREVEWVTDVDAKRHVAKLQGVKIDGQPVHTFTHDAQQVLTSMDNERIAIDLRHRQWQSDFRGAASGQGRCVPMEGPR
jgi:hypothetical protein